MIFDVGSRVRTPGNFVGEVLFVYNEFRLVKLPGGRRPLTYPTAALWYAPFEVGQLYRVPEVDAFKFYKVVAVLPSGNAVLVDGNEVAITLHRDKANYSLVEA